MTIDQAFNIVRGYGKALAERKDGEYARPISLLSDGKDGVIRASKLCIAAEVAAGLYPLPQTNELLGALMFLGYFIEDEQAEKVNAEIKKNQRKLVEFTVAGGEEGGAVSGEISEFITALQSYPKDDPLYWQRACTLIGVEYDDQQRSFWSEFKTRFVQS